jgi:anti-sigma regulatory factor (Ser/Thr protein kinase)
MEVTRNQAAVILLCDPSQVGEARRMAAKVAEKFNLGEERSEAAALVATELATNIFKHAKDGAILVQEIGQQGTPGLQLLAVDKGPGIGDLSAALSDGWSTVGTLGGGLGAMQRSADLFDIYSRVGSGTCVVCEFWKDGKNPSANKEISLGVISTVYPGEEVNGDGWSVSKSDGQLVFMVVDGLGHGPLAAEAAREAEYIVVKNGSNSPAALLQACHEGLAKTRGAAMAAAAVDFEAGLLRYAGTGNISGSISTQSMSRGLASHNGTVGHNSGRIQEFTYPWTNDSLLIMHSDGINTRWNLNAYPGIRAKHPSLVAAVINRDFNRGRDDATVLVAKQTSS